MNNENILLDNANQRFLINENCNVCFHKENERKRCGHIVETCHHPKLNENDDEGWPEVDGTMVCDWFKAKYPKAAQAQGGES